MNGVQGDGNHGQPTGRERSIVAAGVVAGDLTSAGVARFAGVHLADAVAALEWCRAEGILRADGTVGNEDAVRLVADLPVEQVAEIHALAARFWMARGPEHLVAAVEHAKAAGTLVPLDDLIEMADHGGRLSLSLNDYRSATELLGLAAELDVTGDPVQVGDRLCDLAAALDGLGNVNEARRHLARAVGQGEAAGDGGLVARAAVAYALPVDWYAGDTRAAGLLARAEAMELDKASLAKVRAARALVEMRIPIGDTEGQQTAWVTRSSVAHRLADEALDLADVGDRDARGLAVLAWRTIHRSPTDLDRRRTMSAEALDLAQLQRNPSHQMDAAVWLAVDALESADRPLYDEACSVAQWVAERDRNPRLVWRALTLAAGTAHLDGDIEAAERLRVRAREIGESVPLPSWLGAELCLLGEYAISSDDVDVMAAHVVPEDSPLLANPIGRVMNAYGYARMGERERAHRMVLTSMRQLDPEASYLLLATRCAATVEVLGDLELARDLLPILTPWRSHVAVDSNAWWCDGPVHFWLAVLHSMLGDSDRAVEELDAASVMAKSLNDVRTLRRIDELTTSRSLSTASTSSSVATGRRVSMESSLTERERQVLELVAGGLTNREIARELRYSVSTIRADTMSIYRKLGVKGRSEAVATALMHGLVPGR